MYECLCVHWECVRLGECCLGRADGRLGETLPSVLRGGGDTVGEEMAFRFGV